MTDMKSYREQGCVLRPLRQCASRTIIHQQQSLSAGLSMPGLGRHLVVPLDESKAHQGPSCLIRHCHKQPHRSGMTASANQGGDGVTEWSWWVDGWRCRALGNNR